MSLLHNSIVYCHFILTRKPIPKVRSHLDCRNVPWYYQPPLEEGARCSSVVRAFARGAMGRRIDPSWSGPIELFLVPRLV